jgi:5-methylcytosine-specific restriction protein A
MPPLPFIQGQLYNRRHDIHGQFGGSWQSGISPSAEHPYIFIFTSASGHAHGYKDGWDNPNVFSYTGQGQHGDMQFVRGNLALAKHRENGKRVFLFKAYPGDPGGFVRFEGEVEVFDIDYFETEDTTGQMRVGIKFFFKRVGVYVPKISDDSVIANPTDQQIALALNIPSETERRGLVTSRIGQGMYRKRVLHRWEYECAVTGFGKLDVLIASHIVPWSQATNEERLDPENGILLSPAYDALFDRHLITFEDSGKIVLAESIDAAAFQKIGVTGHERINRLHEDNLHYLKRHQEKFQTVSRIPI